MTNEEKQKPEFILVDGVVYKKQTPTYQPCAGCQPTSIYGGCYWVDGNCIWIEEFGKRKK